MPPSICARTWSGLMAVPQSTAHTTRSTLKPPLSSILMSAISATTVPKDSCRATPRNVPCGMSLPHAAFSAARFSTARWRG